MLHLISLGLVCRNMRNTTTFFNNATLRIILHVTSFLFCKLSCLFLFRMFVETIGAAEILCRWILLLNSNRGTTNNIVTVKTGTLKMQICKLTGNNKAGLCSNNAPEYSSSGTCFESQSGYRLSLLIVFVIFPEHRNSILKQVSLCTHTPFIFPHSIWFYITMTVQPSLLNNLRITQINNRKEFCFPLSPSTKILHTDALSTALVI